MSHEEREREREREREASMLGEDQDVSRVDADTLQLVLHGS